MILSALRFSATSALNAFCFHFSVSSGFWLSLSALSSFVFSFDTTIEVN